MRDPAGSLPRSAAGFQRDVRARLTRLEGANPEWRTALAALREVLAVLDRESLLAQIDWAATTEWRAAEGIPRLAGAAITIDPKAIGELFHRIAAATRVPLANDPGLRAAELQSAINETGTVSAIARLAATAVLAQGAREIEMETEGWLPGFCPVCGAWPGLGETRGLERTRRLRCGRCMADWRGELLRCVFCGERDYTRLGSLVPQRGGQNAIVETCLTCRGYLKTMTTIKALRPAEFLLADFETVELDLAAREAGFARSSGLGVPIEVAVIEP